MDICKEEAAIKKQNDSTSNFKRKFMWAVIKKFVFARH